MTTAGSEFGVEDVGSALLRLIEDGTGALAQLDVESLELLQERAIQLKRQLERRGTVRHDLLEPLSSRRRIFNEVFRATGEHADLLRRMGGRAGNGVNPWDR